MENNVVSMSSNKKKIELKKVKEEYTKELTHFLKKFNLKIFEKPGAYFVVLAEKGTKIEWRLIYTEEPKELEAPFDVKLDVVIPPHSKVTLQKIRKTFYKQFINEHRFYTEVVK